MWRSKVKLGFYSSGPIHLNFFLDSECYSSDLLVCSYANFTLSFKISLTVLHMWTIHITIPISNSTVPLLQSNPNMSALLFHGLFFYSIIFWVQLVPYVGTFTDLVGLVLWRSCPGNHSCSEFMGLLAMSMPFNGTLPNLCLLNSFCPLFHYVTWALGRRNVGV